MFKNKNRCVFCNKKLNLSPEIHYIVLNTKRESIIQSMSTYYDAVDCQNCGRQNIMGERYITKLKKVEDDDE